MKFTKDKNFFNLIGFVTVGIVLCLDIFSKNLVLRFIHALPIKVTSFFNIVFLINPGISFSMFPAGSIYEVYGLIFITSLIAVFVLYWLLKAKNTIESLAFGCILGGAMGNLFDRISLGGVIDFIDLHINSYHWPAFNIADTFICIGVFLLFFYQFVIDSQKKTVTVSSQPNHL